MSRPILRRGLLVLAAIGLLLAGLAVRGRWQESALLEEARNSLRAGHFEHAEELALGILASDHDSLEALRIAGEAALRQSKHANAAEYFARLPDGRQRAVAALVAGAQRDLSEARLSAAEGALRAALAIDPQNTDAHFRLATLLDAVGRRTESSRHHFACLKAGRFSVEDLLLLGNPDELFYDAALLGRARLAAPDDPRPLTAEARQHLLGNRTREAIDLLRRIVARAPEQVEAQALLGAALLDHGALDEFAAWERALPGTADDAEIWFVRGRGAAALGQPDAAIRCHWECLCRDPNHRGAAFQLGQRLLAAGHDDSAVPFLERAQMLSDLNVTMHPIYFEGPRVAWLLRTAELMESLGRPWEAWAWYFAVTRYEPGHAAAGAAAQRLRETLDRDAPPRTLAASNPALRIDLSGWPLPDRSAAPVSPPLLTQTRNGTPYFADVADAVGISFQYFNSGDPDRIGKRMFETTGGGVAVLDADADGWPDLHWTQGCRWPPQAGQTEHLDRYFRNLGTGRFSAATAPAGLGDDGYSQGAAVGDLDSDGFDDLYVANIGANRLYHNNGDGTFTEVSRDAGLADDLWTTSCLIADLNGDSHPDLYDVNYLRGGEIFDRLCGARLPHACAPSAFDGAPDRLWLSLGDGAFRDATSEAGLGGLLGKGLGIVAVDLTYSGRLSLLVGNDGEANFYFQNETPIAAAVPPVFREQGLLNGLAFDRDGRAQASMGIAADDADGDGLLDLLVTNFYEEGSTLYLQRPGALFSDETRSAGLRDPTFTMLGFGTQFIDAELDGRPDIVVANGHIDDYSHEGIPYPMRPQFFRNTGGARFEELTAGSLGAYFQGEYLGRGLARLDWDRDGREDFAVSHLDAPAALVTNQTLPAGHVLVLRLRGTRSSRDAIGTTVVVSAGGETWTKQLTAGDGYHASNQRQLVFGLGDQSEVREIIVRWPSGQRQSFRNIPADRESLLVEGSQRLLPLASLSRPPQN
jgi:tetratricopeptide (TPR) repeat protein